MGSRTDCGNTLDNINGVNSVNEGVDGKSAGFNGVNSYLSGYYNFSSDAFTVSFWFNTKDATSVKRIVEHSWNAAPSASGVFTTHLDKGYLSTGITLHDGTQVFTSIPEIIKADTWYHYVLTYDGVYAKIYLNGVLKKEENYNKPFKKANKLLYIGGASGVTLNGSIDEVQIYNYALSTNDILSNYNDQKNRLLGVSPSPVPVGGGGGGGTVVELKDRCLELSNSLKTNISGIHESEAKRNGYNFVKIEGEVLSLYDYVVIYSLNNPNKGRVLQLSSIGGGTSSNDKTTFQDAMTGENFEFVTGVNNVSTRNIDGYTFYVRVTPGFGIGGSVNITWGDGASYGFVGKQKDTFNCPIVPTAQCTDSDGGKNYDLRGHLTDPARNADYNDTCTSLQTTDASNGWTPTLQGKILAEYYCGVSNYQYTYYECPQGCKEGACVKGNLSSALITTYGEHTVKTGDYVKLGGAYVKVVVLQISRCSDDRCSYTENIPSIRLYYQGVGNSWIELKEGQTATLSPMDVSPINSNRKSTVKVSVLNVSILSDGLESNTDLNGNEARLRLTEINRNICSELIEKVRIPETFSDSSDNKWYLSWNSSYKNSWWVENKEIPYTSYYAAWSNNYYNSNENIYNYLSIDINIFDDKNVDAEKLLKQEITHRVCQVNNYNDDIVYICNWNILRNEQSTDGQTLYKSREVLWAHNNIMIRMNLNINQYLNDDQLRSLVEQTTQQFLKDLKSNEYKYSLWKDFDIQYPLSNQLYDTLDSCPSTLSKETCSPYWSCKIEPAVCPPHGEQKQICRDLNRCNDKEEVQEQSISCSPGICNGCYVPKWYGGSDNKCIQYGFRFEHDTSGDLRVYEQTDKERIDQGKVDDVMVQVLSDNEAIITIPMKGKILNYTVKKGQSIDLTQNFLGTRRGNDEEIISVVINIDQIVYSGTGGDNYVVMTIDSKVQGHEVKKVNAYCDIDGQIKVQKTKDPSGEWVSCQNNYECDSNVCSGGQCVEVNDIIKNTKGLKVLLFKALCRITNLFSDEGYNQCLIDNLGTGAVTPTPAPEADLSQSKYLIKDKFEGLKVIDNFQNIEEGDDVVEIMPKGFVDGEVVGYEKLGDNRGGEILVYVLVYDHSINFEEFDKFIGEYARKELGPDNKVMYEKVRDDKMALSFKQRDSQSYQGFIWASKNYVIFSVVDHTYMGGSFDEIIESYYNKYPSTLQGETSVTYESAEGGGSGSQGKGIKKLIP
ncbi:LamG domain-containing protein [Candidatus Pacearchaeota archaeon]|nr:LamG domain-containing protein [Candidatus Pacearchaeota archaeon]